MLYSIKLQAAYLTVRILIFKIFLHFSISLRLIRMINRIICATIYSWHICHSQRLCVY